jgi:hypothetical protein
MPHGYLTQLSPPLLFGNSKARLGPEIKYFLMSKSKVS